MPRRQTPSVAAQTPTNMDENREEEGGGFGDKESDQGESEDVDEGGEFIKVGKPRKVRYTCRGGPNKVCGSILSGKDDSIMCDSCKQWYHPKCQGLAQDAFKMLSKYELLWLCSSCKPSVMSMLELGKHLEARIETAEKKIIEALDKVRPSTELGKKVDEKMANMERVVVEKIKEQKVKVTSSLEEQKEMVKIVPKATAEIKRKTDELREYMEKKDDKLAREVNVLVHNLPESDAEEGEQRKEQDISKFQNMVRALIGDSLSVEPVKVFRLGKKRENRDERDATPPKPRLMLVKLTSKEHVEILIKNRQKLREAGFPNIYLTRDLPPEEREKQRRLRQELADKGKDSHRIFQGRVVPRH